jgi:phage/plasmid-associated DNA primase
MIDRMDTVNAHAYAYAFHNKTITLLEEPLFTIDNVETMKLIMGGEPIILNPKNVEPFIGESNGFVIMTCNHIPWQNYDPTPFVNRAHIFQFSGEAIFRENISPDEFWTIYEEWEAYSKTVVMEEVPNANE